MRERVANERLGLVEWNLNDRRELLEFLIDCKNFHFSCDRDRANQTSGVSDDDPSIETLVTDAGCFDKII
jgi:hypothetical protein